MLLLVWYILIWFLFGLFDVCLGLVCFGLFLVDCWPVIAGFDLTLWVQVGSLGLV